MQSLCASGLFCVRAPFSFRGRAGGGEADETAEDFRQIGGKAVVEEEVAEKPAPPTAAAPAAAAPVSAAKPAAPRGNLALPGFKRLNAFDLINQCGGIALNRMLLSQSERQVVKVRQFTSSMPPLDVLRGIDAALQQMGCDTRLQTDQFKGKGALLSSSGMIGIIVQSYAVSETVHLVEIRRGKGDILEYYKLFNDLVQNKISHLINLPPDMAHGGASEL